MRSGKKEIDWLSAGSGGIELVTSPIVRRSLSPWGCQACRRRSLQVWWLSALHVYWGERFVLQSLYNAHRLCSIIRTIRRLMSTKFWRATGSIELGKFEKRYLDLAHGQHIANRNTHLPVRTAMPRVCSSHCLSSIMTPRFDKHAGTVPELLTIRSPCLVHPISLKCPARTFWKL